jgi:hypothetical protein
MQHRAITVLLLKQKRDEIALLYDLYFDYFSSQIHKGSYKTPDRFTLIAAFASVFYGEVKLAYGYCGFATYPDPVTMKVVYKLKPHHWLIFSDNEDCIIDVIPIDGIFGVSVPQAVIQNKYFKRFFSLDSLPASDWGASKKPEFNTDLEEIVSVLEKLLKKIPF